MIAFIGWLGALCMAGAPFISIRTRVRSSRLRWPVMLTQQAADGKLWNLVCLNIAGIIGCLMHFIFDLDHAVIDSSHRQITRPDGSLDLAAWIKNNTRANIMRDAATARRAMATSRQRRDHRHLHCPRNGRTISIFSHRMAYGGTLAFPARWGTH